MSKIHSRMSDGIVSRIGAGQRRRPGRNNRLFIDAVLYVLKTGVPWTTQILPPCFPSRTIKLSRGRGQVS